MPIKNKLVLEIGSGNRPDVRSDILVDKHLSGQAERAGRLLADRPLVIADGETLPFRSGAFSYVIACHVLEHSNEPDAFMTEMMRVGGAGYIESPNSIAERLFNWPYHRWLVDCEADALVLRKKMAADVQFGHFFHDLVQSNLLVRSFLRRHKDLFFVSHEWRGTIRYRIESREKSSQMNFDEEFAQMDEAQAEVLAKVRQGLGNGNLVAQALKGTKELWYRLGHWKVWWRHRRHDMDDLLGQILCCPHCKDAGTLERTARQYRCVPCGRRYPIRNNIPIFNDSVPEAASDAVRTDSRVTLFSR